MNFLPKNNQTGLMKGAVGACLAASAVMVWAMAWGNTPDGQKAQISDGISTSSEDLVPESAASAHKPKALGNNPANSLVLGPTGDTVRFYEAQSGKSFQVALRTLKTETLSDQRLSGFVRTLWSPTGTEVVSTFSLTDGMKYRYYDYATQRSVPIGQSVTSVAFSPTGHQLAYTENSGVNSIIYAAKPDGSDARRVLETRADEIVLRWPQENTLSVSSKRSDLPGRDLSLVGLDGSLERLIENKENLEYTWSRDGKKLLFSYFSAGNGVQLWYMNLLTQNSFPLAVGTSARKCAWHPDNISVTCGVPANALLPKDVASDKTATLDDLVTIDTSTAQQRRIYTGRKESLLGVAEPVVSSSGAYLVFTNLFDQLPYLFDF